VAEKAAVAVGSQSRFERVSGGDWEGIYLDGKLLAQGHSIAAWQLLRALGQDVGEHEMPGLYEERGEPLPSKIVDLPTGESDPDADPCYL
jgi:hypothetical protein